MSLCICSTNNTTSLYLCSTNNTASLCFALPTTMYLLSYLQQCISLFCSTYNNNLFVLFYRQHYIPLFCPIYNNTSVLFYHHPFVSAVPTILHPFVSAVPTILHPLVSAVPTILHPFVSAVPVILHPFVSATPTTLHSFVLCYQQHYIALFYATNNTTPLCFCSASNINIALYLCQTQSFILGTAHHSREWREDKIAGSLPDSSFHRATAPDPAVSPRPVRQRGACLPCPNPPAGLCFSAIDRSGMIGERLCLLVLSPFWRPLCKR